MHRLNAPMGAAVYAGLATVRVRVRVRLRLRLRLRLRVLRC